MKIYDLTHKMNIHTPGWVGYAGNKMFYAANLQTKTIVTQRIDIALHSGTHIDGAMHGTDGMGDMASYSLDFFMGPGAVVDISEHCDDWSVITPKMIEDAPVDVKEGDILIINTGFHKYWEGQENQDLVKYFCMHPGGKIELLEWMLDKKIKWFGIDCGSGDHAMNTSIRNMRPDLAKKFENQIGMSSEEFFGDFSYKHAKSGRDITDNIFPFHTYAFDRGLTHAENIGGDIELASNRRGLIGAFPWRYEGLEACPCRVLLFEDYDGPLDFIGDFANARN